MSTCTVVVAADGARCGAPAVITFGANDQFAECTLHALAAIKAAKEAELTGHEHPPTRTSRPFVLVKDDRIVGYAQTDNETVRSRARRLGARVVKVSRP